jgi:hypothetical protein
MRFSIFFLLAILATLLSCGNNDEQPKGPLDGSFSGIFIWKQTSEFEGESATSSDTFNLEFTVQGDEFSDSGCFGSFEELGGGSLKFMSDECGCWCNCNPAIDCAGHWLLGSHSFTLDGDSLKMIDQPFNNTITYSTGQTSYHKVEKMYLLKRL